MIFRQMARAGAACLRLVVGGVWNMLGPEGQARLLNIGSALYACLFKGYLSILFVCTVCFDPFGRARSPLGVKVRTRRGQKASLYLSQSSSESHLRLLSYFWRHDPDQSFHRLKLLTTRLQKRGVIDVTGSLILGEDSLPIGFRVRVDPDSGTSSLAHTHPAEAGGLLWGGKDCTSDTVWCFHKPHESGKAGSSQVLSPLLGRRPCETQPNPT